MDLDYMTIGPSWKIAVWMIANILWLVMTTRLRFYFPLTLIMPVSSCIRAIVEFARIRPEAGRYTRVPPAPCTGYQPRSCRFPFCKLRGNAAA